MRELKGGWWIFIYARTVIRSTTATFTIAARFVAGHPAVDDCAGAADSGFNADRIDRAVAHA